MSIAQPNSFFKKECDMVLMFDRRSHCTMSRRLEGISHMTLLLRHINIMVK